MLSQGEVTSPSTTAAFDSRPIDSAMCAPFPGNSSPIWGGCAIQAFLPQPGSAPWGATLQLATSTAKICGFSVWSDAMLQGQGWTKVVELDANGEPQKLGKLSPVPMAWPGMTAVDYVLLGSGMQIVLQAEPGFFGGLTGGKSVPSDTELSWDFESQRLIAGSDAVGILPIRGIAALLPSAHVVATYDEDDDDDDGSVARFRWVTGPALVVTL